MFAECSRMELHTLLGFKYTWTVMIGHSNSGGHLWKWWENKNICINKLWILTKKKSWSFSSPMPVNIEPVVKQVFKPVKWIKPLVSYSCAKHTVKADLLSLSKQRKHIWDVQLLVTRSALGRAGYLQNREPLCIWSPFPRKTSLKDTTVWNLTLFKTLSTTSVKIFDRLFYANTCLCWKQWVVLTCREQQSQVWCQASQGLHLHHNQKSS